MADTKLSALTTALAALADLVYIVDVSDTTDDPAGSSRGTTLQSVLDTLGVPYSRGGGSIAVNSDGSIAVVASASGTTFSSGSVTVAALTTGAVVTSGTGGLLTASPGAIAWDGSTMTVAGDVKVVSGNAFDVVGAHTFSALRGVNAAGADVLKVGDTSQSYFTQVQFFTNAGASADVSIASGNVTLSVGYLDLNGTGWVHSHPGRKRTSTAPTNATNTLSSGLLSDLSVTLVAGKKYTGRMVLIAKNSTGAEGLQFDFNGGTATMTSFQATLEATPIGATVGVANGTALATALTNTAVGTTDAVFAYTLTMVVNAGGTFIPRFAEASAHATGTATVELGSYLWLEDTA